ncbi:hypothetical protein SDC9_132351 [bioreactor metagenome]|uniref:Uncharacterized protein n=1 Tax=bioreactor metagenome TaxID=1076179 RepID=A0A645D8K5_9ZZZZ
MSVSVVGRRVVGRLVMGPPVPDGPTDAPRVDDGSTL